MDFLPTSEHELVRQTMRATASSVDPLAGMQPTGGGRCPPRHAPRAGASGPRVPLLARAGALAGAGELVYVREAA